MNLCKAKLLAARRCCMSPSLRVDDHPSNYNNGFYINRQTLERKLISKVLALRRIVFFTDLVKSKIRVEFRLKTSYDLRIFASQRSKTHSVWLGTVTWKEQVTASTPGPCSVVLHRLIRQDHTHRQLIYKEASLSLVNNVPWSLFFWKNHRIYKVAQKIYMQC